MRTAIWIIYNYGFRRLFQIWLVFACILMPAIIAEKGLNPLSLGFVMICCYLLISECLHGLDRKRRERELFAKMRREMRQKAREEALEIWRENSLENSRGQYERY